MGRYEDRVASVGAGRRGIVTNAGLRGVGVSDDEARRLRDRGVLVSLGRGVDRLRDHPFDLDSRRQALLDLGGDGSVLGLRAAARLHELYRYRRSEAVEVLTQRGRDHRLPFGRLVQTRRLPSSHVTFVAGFPVTTIARTFFDLCGDPDGRMSVGHPAHEKLMLRVYNDAVGRRGLTFGQLATVLTQLARRGRAGTQLVRHILMTLGPDHEPTRSEVESLFMELVAEYGLPEPEKQVVIVGDGGFIGTVDFLWRRARVIVEIDSRWHDGPLDKQSDLERDERLRAAGYEVFRYRYPQLIGHPTRIARELGAATGRMTQ